MKVRNTLLALAGLAVAGAALAESVPRPAMQLVLKPYDVNMRDFAFPSGLRVLFQSDRTQPIVSITMMIDHGSAEDPVGKEGIAHLVEHLWFRSVHVGTDGKDLPKVWDMLREMGANLNASTSNDWTNYMTVAPKQHLDALLRLESLRMREPVRGVTDEVIKIEREVVRNELRLRMENGYGDGFRYLTAKLFPPGHPYARETIGTHDSLNAITLADVQQFTKTNYHPSESTIVIVGDFDLADAPKLLNNFGIDQFNPPDKPDADIALVENPKPRIDTAAPEPPAPAQPLVVKGETVGLTNVHAGVDKPVMMIAWSLPAAYRDDDAQMDNAVTMLQIAMAQELFPSWKWESGNPLDGYGCFRDGNKLASAAICFIETSDAEDGVKLAERALNGLQYTTIADESWRAYQQNVASYSKQAQMAGILQDVDLVSSLGGRATQAAFYLHYKGDPQYYSRQIEAVSRLDAEKSRKIAEKYFTRQRAVAIMLEPYEEGDINVDSSNAQYKGARRDDVLNTVLTESMLTDEVIRKTVQPPDTKKLMQTTLPNGMKLVVMPHSQAPIVKTALRFDGGSYGSWENYFADAHWGSNSVVNPLRVAGFSGVSAGELSTAFQVSGSAGNLGDVIYVLRDRVDNIVADTNGKIDWADAERKNITKYLDDPSVQAELTLWDHVLPGHPYTTEPDHGVIKQMAAWGNSVVNGVLSRILRPEHATLYVVGNIDPKEAQSAAQTYFGTWSGWGKAPEDTTVKSVYDPATPPKDRMIYVFDKPNRSQTQISYSCQLAKLDEKNLPAAEILGDTISESTWLALREQTGASYGAYAYSQYLPGGLGFLGMGVSVQNDTAAMSAKTFLDLGVEARDNKLDPKTIAIVKYNRAQGYVQGHQSTDQMLGRLMSVLGRGWSASFFDSYATNLSKVRGSDFAALLGPCIGKEAVTAVGPKEVLIKQFEELGYPWQLVDLDKRKTDYYVQWGLKLPKDKSDKKK